jgi:hypothetical protein
MHLGLGIHGDFATRFTRSEGTPITGCECFQCPRWAEVRATLRLWLRCNGVGVPTGLSTSHLLTAPQIEAARDCQDQSAADVFRTETNARYSPHRHSWRCEQVFSVASVAANSRLIQSPRRLDRLARAERRYRALWQS